MIKYLLITISVTFIWGQVIHKLQVDRFTHYRIDDWVSYAYALDITSIDMDDYYIYFATKGGGILRYDKYQNFWDFPYTTSSGLSSNYIESVVYNPSENFLYAKTNAGIDVYKPAEKYWRPAINFSTSDRISRMPAFRKPDQRLISETKKQKDFRFPEYFRPDNDYLPPFFTERSFIYLIDGRIKDRYNREFTFTDRLTDMWMRLWIGTNGFGPILGDLYSYNLTSLPQSISDIHPRDIYIDNDYVWIGGINKNKNIGGITLWNRERDTWQYYEARHLTAMNKDDVLVISGNKEYILFGTIDGLVIYEKEKNRWKTLTIFDGLEGEKILDIKINGDTAFIGTESGFNWLHLSTLQIHESRNTILDNIPINQVSYYDKKVWLATRFGLYSIDINKDETYFHPSSTTFNDQYLTALEIYKDEIWICNQYGIAYWDYKKDRWYSYPALTMKLTIRDMEATGNVFWFATDKGLLKLDRQDNYWRLFTKDDGLISNDVYHIDLEGDDIWISTDEGVSVFYWNSEYRMD